MLAHDSDCLYVVQYEMPPLSTMRGSWEANLLLDDEAADWRLSDESKGGQGSCAAAGAQCHDGPPPADAPFVAKERQIAC